MITKISKRRNPRSGFTSASARKVRGTAERPRLAVFRSLKHIYAQVIDDRKGQTLAAASSVEKDGERGQRRQYRRRQGDRQAGRRAGQGKGIKKVVFDRGGYLYHGRVKALADAAREAGLEF